jgi:hypothetical protein
MTVAPVDLATIKDDLGIAADDASHDAWLQRRIDGLWARFQSYTARPLLLKTGWADDWGELVIPQRAEPLPPAIAPRPRGSIFLRVYPVAAITRITVGGTDGDASKVLVNQASGKLSGIDGQAQDLGEWLFANRVRIEYQAGFDPAAPADLYEALLGALGVQFQVRQAMQSGLSVGGLLPTRINAVDVGETDLSASPNFFVEQASRGITDPLLGPWTKVLDLYVDHRALIGGPLPTTTALPVPP